MPQRLVRGDDQRTTVPGDTSIFATCATAASAIEGIDPKAAAKAPSATGRESRMQVSIWCPLPRGPRSSFDQGWPSPPFEEASTMPGRMRAGRRGRGVELLRFVESVAGIAFVGSRRMLAGRFPVGQVHDERGWAFEADWLASCCLTDTQRHEGADGCRWLGREEEEWT
jgi:hypothetical protein